MIQYLTRNKNELMNNLPVESENINLQSEANIKHI